MNINIYCYKIQYAMKTILLLDLCNYVLLKIFQWHTVSNASLKLINLRFMIIFNLTFEDAQKLKNTNQVEVSY
jgi:hypothetical protein